MEKEEKLKKLVEKVNRAYPEIAKLIAETNIDWYGLRSYDEANPPKIIKTRHQRLKAN